MSYKTYETYITPKTNLIEKIPKHWKIVPMTKFLKSIVDYRGKTPKKVNEGIFLVTGKNIKQGAINYELSKEYVKEEEYDKIMSRGKPNIGDVLFTTEAPLGEVANVDKPKIALAQRIIKLCGKSNIVDNYFLKYYMMSGTFQGHLQSLATGSTATGIKSSKLFLLKLILPPYSEQRNIVNYLNKKIATINETIDKNKQLIKLLEEKRNVLINQVVTKGLNHNVNMKDSGVDWIGEIPEHWLTTPLKHFVRLHNGKEVTIEVEEDDENAIGVYGSGGLFKYTNDYLFNGESVLFGRKGTLGKPIYLNDKFWTVDTMYYLSFYKSLLPKYCYYYLMIYPWDKISTETAKPSVVGNDVINSIFAIPDIHEQNKIVCYLNKETSKIDLILSKIKENINLLEEYKISLIHHVVIGEIDVRSE